jgi:CHAT domain-containing protein
VYSYGESESILDYVVSSYTPTVTALTERVKAEHAIDEGVSGLFLTCQPKAPGASSIPGTTREVTAVFDRASLHGLRVEKVEGGDVDIDGCLRKMEAFSSIHLACHASQNSTEFLQSRFLFHRGSLSLDSIMKQNLKNADLAFLSACQTSAGEETLSDEAVHLAAGMLAAGYRRVVATMWAIRDRYAPEIATDFYQYLWDCRTEGCGTGFDGSQSAYALHHATQQLRARLGDTEKALLTWVPYVHFGY